MTPPFDLASLAGHLIKGIAASTIVGAGALLLNDAKTEAVHTVQIQQIQQSVSQIDKLSDKLDKTDADLNRVIGRMEADDDVARNGK